MSTLTQTQETLPTGTWERRPVHSQRRLRDRLRGRHLPRLVRARSRRRLEVAEDGAAVARAARPARTASTSWTRT